MLVKWHLKDMRIKVLNQYQDTEFVGIKDHFVDFAINYLEQKFSQLRHHKFLLLYKKMLVFIVQSIEKVWEPF